MQHDSVVVVTGGGAPGARHSGCAGQSLTTRVAAAPVGAPVIAADGGLELALALGLSVDLVVGDLDSASPAAVAAAQAAGARLVRHASDKDATDLELALDEAAALGPRRIVVLGVEGGRLDHLFAGLLVLAGARYAPFEVDAFVGTARAQVVRAERELEGTVGELVSLLAVHGAAEGVVTSGLAYPLRGETLLPGSSRGVSNRFESATARVSLERGVLIALSPGAER